MSLFDQVSSPYGVGAQPFHQPSVPQQQVGLMPPNSTPVTESTLAAVSAGRMPNNTVVNSAQGGQGQTLASINATAGANGTQSPATGATSLTASFNMGNSGGGGGSDAGGAANVNVAGNTASQVEVTADIPAGVIANGTGQILSFAATPVGTIAATLTAAPSGNNYQGGTLTAAFGGATGQYTVQLSTGQLIANCTLTANSTAFLCRPTVITGAPTAALIVIPLNYAG
jgi:hypothetical protein